MKEFNFPKLKYPLKTKGLSIEAQNILLAYDMIWRVLNNTNLDTHEPESTFWLDIQANLSNLGYYIEHTIAKGHAEFIFELEGYCKEGIFAAEPNEPVQLELFQDATEL